MAVDLRAERLRPEAIRRSGDSSWRPEHPRHRRPVWRQLRLDRSAGAGPGATREPGVLAATRDSRLLQWGVFRLPRLIGGRSSSIRGWLGAGAVAQVATARALPSAVVVAARRARAEAAALRVAAATVVSHLR